MSLDIDLLGEEESRECTCLCGNTHTHTTRVRLFECNITHNLGKMAAAVGIYEAVWRPEEVGIKTAKDMIPILELGISKLLINPEKYKKFNSPNDWGMHENFVPWLEEYLQACKEYPKALVVADR